MAFMSVLTKPPLFSPPLSRSWPHLAVTPAEQEAALSLKWINALMEVAGLGEGV